MADTRCKIREFAHLPHIFDAASATVDGMMSAADKVKLDSIPAGGGGGATVYANQAAFPPAGLNVGSFAIDQSTSTLFVSFGGVWNTVVILAG